MGHQCFSSRGAWTASMEGLVATGSGQIDFSEGAGQWCNVGGGGKTALTEVERQHWWGRAAAVALHNSPSF